MDRELRLQILRAAYSDRLFLKSSAGHINPDWFQEPSERAIAQAEIDFWNKYQEPIGVMLRTNAEELAHKNKFGSVERKKLNETISSVIHQNGNALLSIKALQDKLRQLKRDTFYEQAIDDIITAHEKGSLSPELLSEMVDRAKIELGSETIKALDYLSKNELLNRIARRKISDKTRKYPRLLIKPLDAKIKIIGRGHVGLWIAPFASGKGMALLHTARSYALQGLNVLHFTLEDTIEEVTDRLDSAIAGVPKNQLAKFPVKLKRRFLAMKKLLRGRIKVIDATEGGWTITRIEQVWDEQRQAGFIADAITIDYDDELECEVQFKGDSFRRMQFAEIYRRIRRMSAKLNVIVWTAAQGTRASEGHMQVTGRDTAEDLSKVRKVTIAIGIGTIKDYAKRKHLFVGRHRLDRSRFGVDIATDFDGGVFYDAEETEKIYFQKRQDAQNKK